MNRRAETIRMVLFRVVMPNLCRSISPARQLLLEIHNLLDLRQKPAVDLRELENLLDRESGPKRVADEKHALGVGNAQLAADHIAREDVAVAIDFRADAPWFAVAAQAAAADLERTQAFLQAFFERPADGHGFANRFHLGRQRRVSLREFLKREAR